MKRLFTFVLIIAVIAVVGLNWKTVLSFGRAREIEQSAQKSIQAGNWEQAIQLYEAAHKQFPDNDEIAVKLAWLYRQNSQDPPSLKLYRMVLERNPNHRNALSGFVALVSQDSKQINEAVVMLRKALKQTPEDPYLLTLTGDLYKTAAENPEEERNHTRQWLYKQAGYYYAQAQKLAPKTFHVLFNQGVVYQNLDQQQKAAQSYCQAIVEQPQSYEAHYNLGLVLSELNYQAEAYRQMERAIQLLTEQGSVGDAQGLALQVQQIKNRVFHRTQPTLNHVESPAFLEKSCLLGEPNKGEKSGQE